MDPRLQLWLVGLSHRSAPVGVREHYVVGQDDLGVCLRGLAALPNVKEVFVVSTCNRTEALVVSERPTDPVPAISQQVFRNLAEEHVYVYDDVQAVIHLFRVASGLDSLVVGETEVLGQIKRSLDAAAAQSTLGPILRPLLQQALHVGKRVRTETGLGEGTLSVARVAIDLAGHVVGQFDRARALIIGSGETGRLVGRHLAGLGVQELVFANRTVARAEEAAAEIGGEAAGLDDLGALIGQSDIVFACVDGCGTTLGRAELDPRVLARRDRPLFVADLSVPRAVAPEVRGDDAVLLYDLDDLGKIVEHHRRERHEAAEGSSEILVAELHKFLSLRTYASFGPAIERLRERFGDVRDAVVDAVCGETASPKEVELAHQLERRLLDVALDQMKDSARKTRSEHVLDQEYRRFMENQ